MKKKALSLISAVIFALSVFAVTASAEYNKLTTFDLVFPFSCYEGSGDAIAEVDFKFYDKFRDRVNADELINVKTINGEEIAAEFYTVQNTENSMIFTLKEDYAENLADGTYYIDADFEKAIVNFRLDVVTQKKELENNVVLTDSRANGYIHFNLPNDRGTYFNPNVFEGLFIGDEEIPADEYEISILGNTTSIAVKKDYFKTIETHIIDVDARFKTADLILRFANFNYFGGAGDRTKLWYDNINPQSNTSTKYISMINNPYYSKYYNELLAYSNEIYQEFIYDNANSDDRSYIDSYCEKMTDDINYATVIFKNGYLENKTKREYNLHILEKYFEDDEILYVSDYLSAAVVCIPKEKVETVKNMEELLCINAPFFTSYPSVAASVCGEYYMGDVFDNHNSANIGPDYDYSNPKNCITAADARLVLRFAAGLESDEQSKRFYFTADMNFDGKINSADARLILRTAAGLEEIYQLQYGYSYMWSDFMLKYK